MNIVMVCESATVSGGAEKVAIQEAVELRRRGHRVGYIAANDQPAQELIQAQVETLLLDTKSFFEETRRREKLQKMFGNQEISDRIRQFLSGFPKEETVVHLHTFRLKLSGIVPHIAQEMGFATVVHGHDYSPVCPTSLLYDHRAQANCERKPMSLSCIACECQNQPWRYKLPKLTSFYMNQSVWRINRRSNGILHISDLERSTMESKMPGKVKALRVTPISDSMPTQRVPAETNQNYLFIGRVTAEKGVRQFLESATRAGVSAVVVGDGPLASELKAKFPNARFTGWIDKDQITQELVQARAVVVPSVWRETLCLSVIDAMQVGVPCIVSPTVGAKEYIVNGENGLVSDNLGEAFDQMKSDVFVQKLSESAFAKFQANPLSIERHVDGLLEIYAACLKEGR
ncbi:MAG: glycosyltransferase family 4 protein [Armatimonadetes bacterium]|nr:glycosyltransferase family 4 protein [Armatimonadota bacterium]